MDKSIYVIKLIVQYCMCHLKSFMLILFLTLQINLNKCLTAVAEGA